MSTSGIFGVGVIDTGAHAAGRTLQLWLSQFLLCVDQSQECECHSHLSSCHHSIIFSSVRLSRCKPISCLKYALTLLIRMMYEGLNGGARLLH